MNVNATLDRLVRVEISVAGRRQPTFRVCALTGFALAVALGVALTYASGLSLAVTGLLAVVCATTFVVHTLARKVATGEERLVYYHHEIACVATSALALWLLGEPMLAYLDIAIIGIGVCLAAGRLGCFAVGCCHGRPSALGVRYGGDHVAEGLAPAAVGIRLFPVQLVEAAAAAGIVAACSAMVLAGATAGSAFAFYIVVYGGVRFALEFGRGDAGRGDLAGMTQPQWLSLASGVVLIALGAGGAAPVGPLHIGLTAALVAVAVWLAVGFRLPQRVHKRANV
jgi:prolipoprotein diacylglyceryltransferase